MKSADPSTGPHDHDDRVGYIAGAFDVLTPGHLDLLEAAAAQCTRLVAGVATDALYERQEHRKPMLPYADRARMVAALRAVDDVVPYRAGLTDTWNEVRFAVAFVEPSAAGTPELAAARAVLEANDARIVVLPDDYRTAGTHLLRHLVQRVAAI